MSAQRSLKPRSNYSGCNTILMSKVCYEFGGAIIVKHKIKVTVTTGKPIGCNLFCTKKLIYLLFRLLTTEEFRRRIKKRMLQQRRMDVSPQMMMLIPPQERKVWGEKRIGNKVDMIAEMVGYKPRINSGRDDPCMSLYLSRVSRSGLDQPSMLTREQFLPRRSITGLPSGGCEESRWLEISQVRRSRAVSGSLRLESGYAAKD